MMPKTPRAKTVTEDPFFTGDCFPIMFNGGDRYRIRMKDGKPVGPALVQRVDYMPYITPGKQRDIFLMDTQFAIALDDNGRARVSTVLFNVRQDHDGNFISLSHARVDFVANVEGCIVKHVDAQTKAIIADHKFSLCFELKQDSIKALEAAGFSAGYPTAFGTTFPAQDEVYFLADKVRENPPDAPFLIKAIMGDIKTDTALVMAFQEMAGEPVTGVPPQGFPPSILRVPPKIKFAP